MRQVLISARGLFLFLLSVYTETKKINSIQEQRKQKRKGSFTVKEHTFLKSKKKKISTVRKFIQLLRL